MKRLTEPGDSGSFVVDAKSGDIYGMLIAGSVMMQEGYLIPARAIFDDIKRVGRKREVRLPTLHEVLRLATQIGTQSIVDSLRAAGAAGSTPE